MVLLFLLVASVCDLGNHKYFCTRVFGREVLLYSCPSCAASPAWGSPARSSTPMELGRSCSSWICLNLPVYWGAGILWVGTPPRCGSPGGGCPASSAWCDAEIVGWRVMSPQCCVLPPQELLPHLSSGGDGGRKGYTTVKLQFRGW